MRRTILVSTLTLVSRVLGLAREVLSVALFGSASPVYDAFITAWRVPNLFRRFLGEGALSTSLQTAITEEDADRGNEAGRRLFLHTTGVVTWILVGLCAVVMGLVHVLPDVMPVTGWLWLGADPEPVRRLTLQLMPFVVLICLTALGIGALQVRGHYRAPLLGPVVMNTVWIGALLLVAARFGWQDGTDPRAAATMARQLDMARLLGWGVLLSGLLQLLVLVPALLANGLLTPAAGSALRSEVAPHGEAAPPASRHSGWSVLRASMPLALGAAVYQINVMTDGLMAESLLPDGGPTAHYCANRIQQFPLALIAIAATSAVFPALKALGHLGRRDELRRLHDTTQLGVCALAIPACVGLFLLAREITAVLLQHGAFLEDGVGRVAAALRMLALALLPAGAAGLASRVYYALDDFRTPVRIAIAMLALNVALNVVFVVSVGMDADGLALATALTSWGNFLILLPGLTGRLGLPRSTAPVAGGLARVALGSALAGAAAWGAHRAVAGLLVAEGGDPARSAGALLAAGVAGVGSYALLARALGMTAWLRRGAPSGAGGSPDSTSRSGPGGTTL